MIRSSLALLLGLITMSLNAIAAQPDAGGDVPSPADVQLYRTACRLEDPASPARAVLPELLRLVDDGATTSAFPSSELGGFNLAELISRRFLLQDLERDAPDPALFECVRALIGADGQAALNKAYCGNGGLTCSELLDPFMASWRHPIHRTAGRGGGGVPARDHARAFFLQCLHLQRLIPTRHRPQRFAGCCCRPCWTLDEWRFAPRDRPVPDYIADLIVEFLARDLVDDEFERGPDLGQCHDGRHRAGAALGRADPEVLMKIAANRAVLGVLLPLALSSQDSVRDFLNAMQRSKASRKLLVRFLLCDEVGAVLLGGDGIYDALVGDLVRRRDRRTLEALLRKYGPSSDRSRVGSQLAALRRQNTEKLAQLLSRYCQI